MAGFGVERKLCSRSAASDFAPSGHRLAPPGSVQEGGKQALRYCTLRSVCRYGIQSG